jgi:U3 small nucleolar RNA-associated protein 22
MSQVDFEDTNRHGREGMSHLIVNIIWIYMMSTEPLTGHELRDIKDAADLYQSGSFKLQVCLDHSGDGL